MSTTTSHSSSDAPVAFLFPGQGSQKVGMGAALAAAFPVARSVFDEVDEAVGFPLSRLCFEGPESELVLTANAQPAILATSIAALRVIEQETPMRPSAVAGHSLGEYSALVCAASLTLADAVRLVRLRGQFMQDAVPAGTGSMAAIVGLSAADVETACRQAVDALMASQTSDVPAPVVSPANLNGGGQIVISGHKAAVAKACEIAKKAGARGAIPLAVSAPFHSQLMQPAADRLAAELARVEIRDPRVPVITNVEADTNQRGGRVRELLTRQVTAPVRWEESVQRIASLGICEAIEVGHGAVLAGLVKRIAPGIHVRGAGDPAAIQALRRPSEVSGSDGAAHA